MMTKEDIIKQTKLAYNFLDKLIQESTYLIKEIEGLLGKEPEEFKIGRGSGYGIFANTSRGLDSTNVPLWLLKKFSVFFIPKSSVKTKGGQTITEVNAKLKVIYVKVILDDKKFSQPTLIFGVFHSFEKKRSDHKMLSKFERYVGYLESQEDKVFQNLENLVYEDSYLCFKGKLFSTHLFDINNSQEIAEKVIKPVKQLFTKLQ